MTRTLEILGLQPRQRFRIDGLDDCVFWINDMAMWQQKHGVIKMADSCVTMAIIDDPGLVIEGDTLTADQRNLLMCLYRFMGVKWLAMDMTGTVGMFSHKPEKGLTAWYADEGSKAWFEEFHTDVVTWEDDEPFDVPTAPKNQIK